jgi:competence protein ComEA
VPDPFDHPRERSEPLLRPPPRRTLRDRVERLADATGTTPARLAAGAAGLAAAVAVALWLTRPAAPPPEVALPFATTVAAAQPSTTSTSAVPEELVVHVAGAVARPGVHTLALGARVVDAVDAAGGLAPTADGARLNLAAPVSDGERVYVPALGEEPPPVVGGTGGAAGTAGGAEAGPVNLNQADAQELDALPGVGPATAAAIIEHRERIGGFTSVDQLLDVRGIGEAKLEQLRPLVTV